MQIGVCHCVVVIVESYCVERATTSTGSYRASILFERGSLRKEVVCETCAVCAVHSERRERTYLLCLTVRAHASPCVCVCYKGEARARGGEEPLVLTLSDVTRPHMPH